MAVWVKMRRRKQVSIFYFTTFPCLLALDQISQYYLSIDIHSENLDFKAKWILYFFLMRLKVSGFYYVTDLSKKAVY